MAEKAQDIFSVGMEVKRPLGNYPDEAALVFAPGKIIEVTRYEIVVADNKSGQITRFPIIIALECLTF